jgi:O-antigen/teichoic acid export membrane protein
VRSVRVLRNIVSNYLRFALAGLIGFVITPVLVHGLGDRDYGLWVTVFSLTGYFGLLDQGIRPSLVRYVSRDHARGDDQGVARTLSSAVALYGALGILTIIVTLAVAAAFTRFMRVDPAQVDTVRQVILIAGASIALGFPLGVFGAALSGLQRYDLANLVGVAVGIARALGFVVVLRLGGGLVGLAWVSLGMNLVGHLLSWLLVLRLVPGMRMSLAAVTRERLALIGAYSGFAFVGALANSLTFQTDALVITGFLGSALVTPFALAAGLVDNARSLVHSGSWVLAPTASELDTRGETGKLHEMVIAGAKYSVLLSWPVLFALVIFGPDLIETWVGARYVAGPLAWTLLHPGLWRESTSAAPLLVWLVVALALFNAFANLGLSLLWVRPFGLAGVALGTAVPLALVGGVATMAYTCRALSLPPARYAWQGFGRPGFMTLAFLVPALVERVLWDPVGWWSLGTAVGGPWIVFLVVAWRLGLDDGERRRWRRMARGLFGLPVSGREAGR